MSAILHGAELLHSSRCFEGPVNGLPGHAWGFTVSVLCKVQSQAINSTKCLFSQRAGTNPGWDLLTQGTNSSVVFRAGNASTLVSSPASNITTDDVNRLMLFTGVYDGANVRLYARRAEAGTAVALSGGYVPNTSAKPIIGSNGAGDSGYDLAVYGVYYAFGVATLGHIMAQFDAVQVSERIQPCPDMPGTLIDLTEDVKEAGGALPATLKDRSTGGVNFTRVGAPVLSPHYARAWAW